MSGQGRNTQGSLSLCISLLAVVRCSLAGKLCLWHSWTLNPRSCLCTVITSPVSVTALLGHLTNRSHHCPHFCLLHPDRVRSFYYKPSQATKGFLSSTFIPVKMPNVLYLSSLQKLKTYMCWNNVTCIHYFILLAKNPEASKVLKWAFIYLFSYTFTKN